MKKYFDKKPNAEKIPNKIQSEFFLILYLSKENKMLKPKKGN